METLSKFSKLNRWPLVCTKCKFRYSSNCKYVKLKYDAKTAQRKADENNSIYQIKIENKDKINKSIT